MGRRGCFLFGVIQSLTDNHSYEGPSPFVEVEDQQWYRTGDLVSADEDGYLQFRGRLKRFLKAGGEMISLPALEKAFSEKISRR